MGFAKIPLLSTGLVALFCLTVGCAENEASKKAQKNPGNRPNHSSASNAASTTDDICSSLQASQIASDLRFADFVGEFCGGLAAQLRQPSNQYRGNGSPNIQKNAVQKGKESQMRLWASMATPARSRAYFNMMRLQSGRPDDFKNQGFEFDQNIDYEVLERSGTAIRYHYKNSREDVTVEYNATSNFIEVASDQLYLVTSVLDQALGTVKTFRGLQIIASTEDASGQFTEVFSMSDQLYSNNDDHQTTIGKVEKEFQQDTLRAFRNSKKADAANQFFTN